MNDFPDLLGKSRSVAKEIEAALLAEPSVIDCLVLDRPVEGETAMVACVVLNSPFRPDRLRSHLQARLPSHQQPKAFIPLSRLPLTEKGDPDRHALAALPILDQELAGRWEERIAALNGVEQVAVMIEDNLDSPPPLHLSRLLPGRSEAGPKVEVAPGEQAGGKPSGNTEGRAQAISHGPPLQEEADGPKTLAEALHRAAGQEPAKGVVCLQPDGSEDERSYKDLLAVAERILAGLRASGVEPRDKIILQLERNQDFIASFWACALGGFVPVPISIPRAIDIEDAAIGKLFNAWQMLGEPVVLSDERLARGVHSLAAAEGHQGFQVITIESLREHDPDHDWHESDPDDLAVLMLTSGSTGMPKAVMLSHRNLLARSAATIQFHGFTAEEITFNWFALDHVVGLVMFHVRDVFLGCRQIHAPSGLVLQDPLRWLDWIDRYRVTVTWAPNFAYGLVNARAGEIARRQWDLSSLGCIINGGEAVVAKTARRFMELLIPHQLPETAMRPAWGMAETSSGIVLSDRFSLDPSTDTSPYVDLGGPLPGLSLRIVDDQEQVVPEGTAGRLQVQGLSVTSGYYRHPELNEEIFSADGWFNTGDLAFLEEGRLTLTGREKDVIIINGANFSNHEIETEVEAVAGVEPSYAAAVAVLPPEGEAEQLAVFFCSTVSESNRLAQQLKKIRANLLRNVGVNPGFLIPVAKERIPKTAIGKIQRSQLRKQFEGGEFDNVLERMDILLRSDNTIPDWFYQRVWQRQNARVQARDFPGGLLIFQDASGTGELLQREAGSRQIPAVTVEAGEDFAKIGDDRYRISPGKAEHYQRLFASLAEDGREIDQILHLWSYGGEDADPSRLEVLEEAQELGFYSLLFLTQALAGQERPAGEVRLFVISSHCLPVLPDDPVACEKGTIPGLLKTIPQEIPWLHCRHVDLPAGAPSDAAASILRELAVVSEEPEVAFRGGHRWVSRLQKIEFPGEPRQEFSFERGALYLVTGGLGGIGLEVARMLLQRYGVRLLLLGRTLLPAEGGGGAAEDPGQERLETFRELAGLGGEVAYEAVDICDPERLQEVVRRAEAKWQCELAGIIHLAGIHHEQSLTEETREEVAAALRPKIAGTWSLARLLRSRPKAALVNFSSVGGYFGGATIGAFAAASSFLDALTCSLRNQSLKGYNLAWTLWNETGMSRGYQLKELARSRGYYALSVRQGLDSLRAALRYGLSRPLIGLDGANRHIRRHTVGEGCASRQLTAYLTANAELPPFLLREIAVEDRFQIPSQCSFVQLDEMPLTPAGEIDRAQLGKAATGPAGGKSAPLNEIEREVAQIWQEVLGLAEVGVHDNFFELGGHSLLLAQVHGKVQEVFAKRVSIVEMFKYPTVHALAEFLGQEETGPETARQGLARAEVRSGRLSSTAGAEIAVVGMACNFPGAKDLDTFWQNLCEGVESITFFSDEEVLASGVNPALVANPSYVKAGPVLPDIEWFDAEFFGVNAKEAQIIDPQHRLFFECAWEALENAGYNPYAYPGAIGVYAGAGMNTYLLNNIFLDRAHLEEGDPSQVLTVDSMGGFHVMTTNDKEYLATRLSYRLNLRGPSINVQTACSTTLVTIHMACQSLLNGECDLVLSGGVSLKVPQTAGYLFQEGMIVSPDGHCRAFDAKAQGTIFGDGAGVVVLKRLNEAVRDGDHIYAVIKGTAVNNDGGVKVGYMAPSEDGQASVMAEALTMSGVEAESISYVEAHGTGTELGDPIEVGALTQAFRLSTDKTGFCPIGSVKTNIGHLQIASGIAGFIKTVLALHHRQLPPSLHYERPNPMIDFEQSPFYVNTELREWQTGETPRRAGVNSLGIGGTNAHVILEEAPEPKPARNDPERPLHLLTLSARTDKALQELVQRHERLLREQAPVSLADVCFTANTGREHFDHRLAVAAGSVEELAGRLRAYAEGYPGEEAVHGRRPEHSARIAFLCTGQGAQYQGMGRQLYKTQPTFRRTLDQCAEILDAHLETPLLALLYEAGTDTDGGSLLNATANTQPALFALEYSLAVLWQSWGVEPSLLMGHSVGEYVAACLAGVFSLEDGLKLIAARGRLMQGLPAGGKMAAVLADEGTVLPFLEPHGGEVAIAALNGPSNTVISGSGQAVGEVCAALAAAEIETRPLAVSHAFHSPLMEPMLDSFRQVAAEVAFSLPRIPVVSNLSGTLAGEEIATPEYWVSHVRQPVRFAVGMEILRQEGCDVFLEIGPKTTLLGMGRQCLPETAALWLPSLRHGQEDWPVLLRSLADLYVRGLGVDWEAFDRDYQRRRLPLPTYPFQRQRYWLSGSAGLRPRPAAGLPPLDGLLDRKLRLAAVRETVFESEFSTEAKPVLAGHVIYGEVIVPGASHLSMMASAAARFSGAGAVLENVVFQKALVLQEGAERTVQLVLLPEEGGRTAVQLLSLSENEEGWTVHATATLDAGQREEPAAAETVDLDELRGRCPEEISGAAVYQAMEQHQFQLDRGFRWVESVWMGNGEALCRLRSPEGADGADRFRLHPGLLDSCFQPFFLTVPVEEGQSLVPFSLERFSSAGLPGEVHWCHINFHHLRESNDSRLMIDSRLLAEDGRLLAEATGLEIRMANSELLFGDRRPSGTKPLYAISWQATEKEDRPRPKADPGSWLLFSDLTGVGEELASLLAAEGERVVRMVPGSGYEQTAPDSYRIRPEAKEDFQRLLRDCLGEDHPPCRGVVHLWGLDQPGSPASPPEDAQAGCLGVLHLVQALDGAGLSDLSRLALVTRGGQPIAENAGEVDVQQSSLWGLGRAIFLEHPGLRGVCMDLDPAAGAEDSRLIFAELRSPDSETQIGWRRQTRYTARLEQRNFRHGTSLEAAPIREEGTYLITGGLGALGLEVARWLASRGARNLVLVGRRPASANVLETIDRLEQEGIKILVINADVAVQEEVAGIFADISAAMPPLLGVVHAAGVVDDALLVEQDPERFARVFAPKAHGAWNLHLCSREAPLDFFTMFSSAVSLLGNQGQGNYAAANAFLDGLAHSRRREGLPGTSINWGPWGEIGMASRDDQLQRLMDAWGFTFISPAAGLDLFGEILVENPTQVGVIDCDWDRYLSQLPPSYDTAFFAALARESARETAGGATPAVETALLEKLRGTAPPKQERILIDYLKEMIAKVIGRESAQSLDSEKALLEQGFDSLMAVELRNVLGKRLGKSLPVSLLFNYPAIADIALHLRDEVLQEALMSDEEAAETAGGAASSADDVLADIESLL